VTVKSADGSSGFEGAVNRDFKTLWFSLLFVNEKRQMLIFKAWKNGGYIRKSTANRLYSGNNGIDALQSLVFQGYFSEPNFGVFTLEESKLSDLPQELVDKIQRYEESKSGENEQRYEAEVEKEVAVPE
jgi:hypothetical protein